MTLALLADKVAKPLPMPWSRIKRVLDTMEARFVRGALRLQEARVRALEPLVERVLETGLVPAVVPLQGDFSAMVADFTGEVLVEGIVHATSDVRAEERRARAAGVNLKVDGEAVVPKEALAFIESRRDLARFFDPDQVQKVRTIMGNALREGATVKQTMNALQTALPAASRARLENIARTEATSAYNQGRIYRFLQSKGFVVAVQFMATLDSRVTDICQHRDGLVFSLKDPRIRENTPPLHFQCRSIVSPVSGYKLQKMGGQDRLDKDARAMDDAPGVQVTKKGRFGNEPWPETPGGSAPVPRATPVGPAPGGAVAERPTPVPSTPTPAVPPRGSVDTLPRTGGPVGPGRIPDGPVSVPPGLNVSFGPKVTQNHPAVRGVLSALGELPDGVMNILRRPNVSIIFDNRNPFTHTPIHLLWPAQVLQDLWETAKSWIGNPTACSASGVPKPGDIAMFFRPDRLLFEARNLRWAAYHEAGHTIHRLLALVGDSKIRSAFDTERAQLLQSFQKNEMEFVAEGFAYYHMGGRHRQYLETTAPLLHGIVGGRMASLQSDVVQVLFRGPEGIALYEERDDAVFFALDLGDGKKGGDLYASGEVVEVGGDCKSAGGVDVSWSTQRTWTPEEAEPYKAFLRSKGITLPHVRS